jgi:hypothetical protein
LADPSKVRDRAEAEFRKKAQAEDGRAAASEYRAEAIAIREKTARLRAARLAKEAADAAAPPPPPKPKAKPAARKKRVSP